jgi:8-oxo-dGTP pyrophosphatase MutT (NUDIX family)
VLILLYADPDGNLRVVITMRAKTLSSCTYLSLVFGSARHADLGLDRCRRGGITGRYVRHRRKRKPKNTEKAKRKKKANKICKAAYPETFVSRKGGWSKRGPTVQLGIKILTEMETGRADTLAETPFQTARREAKEEIGLPEIGQPLPRPFSVEHLCELPANLAKTEVVVRPCVALLHSYDSATGMNADPEVSLIPQLDAREVAAVFTAPFHSFLHLKQDGRDSEDWYRGSWSRWHNSNWRSRLNPFPFPSALVILVDPPLRYSIEADEPWLPSTHGSGPAVKQRPTSMFAREPSGS